MQADYSYRFPRDGVRQSTSTGNSDSIYRVVLVNRDQFSLETLCYFFISKRERRETERRNIPKGIFELETR